MKAKKILALLLSAVFVVSCMTFALPASAVTELGNVYDVPKASAPITMDGVIDTESEWKGAADIDISTTKIGWYMTGESGFTYG